MPTSSDTPRGFSPGLWNAQSEAAVVAAILLICTNMDSETFERFKTIGALAGADDLLVLEANDDSLWGINMFADAFMDRRDVLAGGEAHELRGRRRRCPRARPDPPRGVARLDCRSAHPAATQPMRQIPREE